jgi:DNA-binding transcriptional MerR regulator
MAQTFFSTLEVSKKTGCTLRQLQWWDERAILQPTVPGIRAPNNHSAVRLYTHNQIRTVKRMLALRKAGVPLRKCRRLSEMDWRSVKVVAGVVVLR